MSPPFVLVLVYADTIKHSRANPVALDNITVDHSAQIAQSKGIATLDTLGRDMSCDDPKGW